MVRVQVNIRVDNDLVAAAATRALSRGETITAVLTAALTEYSAGRWAPPPPATDPEGDQ